MAYIGKVPADVLIDPMVDSAAITDATIVTADLANAAVTSAKLAADSVDSSELVNGSVDNAHLAGSIAMNKTNLTAGTGLTLSTDTLSVDAAQTQITSVGTLTGLSVGISAVSKAHIYENTTATDSSAGLTIEQAGTGDAILQFLETGTQRWVVGLDNSDSDKFKISSDGDLNTNARLTIDTSGKVSTSANTTSLGALIHNAHASGYGLKITATDANASRYIATFNDKDDNVKATINGDGSATFAGDISMTGGQKKMKLHNSSNTVTSMLRISNRDTFPSSGNWADEYIVEIHGATTSTASEVLMFLQHHENSSDRPILRAKNNNDHVIELGSNELYKFRGKLSVGQAIFDATELLHVKGTSGNIYGRIETTASNSAAGLYLIGTSTDQSRLYFGDESDGAIGGVVYFHSDNKMKFKTGGDFRFTIESDGNLVSLHTYGNGIQNDTYRDMLIRSDGLLGCNTSSQRYKEDIKDMPDTSWIYNLRPVDFKWKASDSRGWGLIAEEVELIEKRLVTYDED